MGTNGKKISENHLNKFNIVIKKKIYEEMISYCRSNLPYEACGLLSGAKGQCTTLWKIKNEYQNRNRFMMSAESIKAAVQEMEQLSEGLSGIFHSHPTSPAVPSTHDMNNNSYPELPYFIVSFYKGKTEVKGYKVVEKRYHPLSLKIID
ncbi:Mov34/MPN/PAD-1 family protein [Cytobacillus sp.]|uniref:Mov34/MPN/PAD-1 family protein n=1 Tax=Cytobacillus sp. TaxID=2675269 RepID=UPI0035128DC0